MEILLNLTLDEICEQRKDRFSLNLRKRRLLKSKRKMFRYKCLSLKRKIPKNESFIKTIKSFPEDIFYSHFRMNWATFKALEKALTPHWVSARLGRDGHSLENCLYMTLWKLCNSRVTFRQLSDRFNIAKGTSHRVFNKTIQAICNLKSEIEWPSVDRQQEVMTNFENSRESPFPFVIGCLDGTHFNIPTPGVDAISYYDRKGNHSVSMQAICDSQYRFLDVFIGYPGSCHDANVWTNSPIFQAIISGELQLAPSAVILGDSAYPISQFLMIPHRDNGHLSREQKTFNARLNSTRVFIEQAFGIFKKKFKILNYIEASSIKATSNVIFACAILHNFIINRGGYFEHVNDTITHADMETNNEIGGIQDAPIRRVDSDDINGIDRRNYFTTLFSS
ncbi:putative nuclease HARBI1 [Anastrepha obliqua]|uniref:putative nuclease HARBI1 n=1 Tax=Anastrepha obliqua TaxID=95512 RepID=UPI00240A9236|nr:putative nuclease HARBI1 [Anastrepha obliqua]